MRVENISTQETKVFLPFVRKSLIQFFPSDKLHQLLKLDDLEVVVQVNVVGVERGEEDELVLPVLLGEVDDVADCDLSVHLVHEHVKLIKDSEKLYHFLLKRNCNIGRLNATVHFFVKMIICLVSQHL